MRGRGAPALRRRWGSSGWSMTARMSLPSGSRAAGGAAAGIGGYLRQQPRLPRGRADRVLGAAGLWRARARRQPGAGVSWKHAAPLRESGRNGGSTTQPQQKPRERA
eukprot:13436915-Heterocapsa_arctica.AAC.1